MKYLYNSLLILCSLLCSACISMKPDRDSLLEEYDLSSYSAENKGVSYSNKWWKQFNSSQLDRLMTQAFDENFTLEQALARLEQAAAIAKKAGADRSLQLNGQASAGSNYSSIDSVSKTDESYNLGLYASYELDLWGKLRSQDKAALASYQATVFDLQTAGMTLSSEVSTLYFEHMAQKQILDIYESQLESNQKMLSALELRFKTGDASSLDVLQQRQAVAASEAKLPPVKAKFEQQLNQLAVLLGKTPGTNLELTYETLSILPQQPESGIPAELLENRPDVRSAFLALESADWDISAAKAARLPSITLSANATTSGENTNQLFDDWASNLAAGLLTPILDGGYLKAEVERTEAVAREKVAAYSLAVLEAYQEVEDALISERYQLEYCDAIEKQFLASKRSESESIHRYQRGVIPFLDALTATVSRESLEINTVEAQLDLLSGRIQLYRSLGGDWTFILENN